MRKIIVVATLCLFLAGSMVVYASGSIIKIMVDGKEIKSDVHPQIIHGRTFVPIRTVAEALNASVDWDEKNNTVVIATYKAPVSSIKKIGEKITTYDNNQLMINSMDTYIERDLNRDELNRWASVTFTVYGDNFYPYNDTYKYLDSVIVDSSSVVDSINPKRLIDVNFLDSKTFKITIEQQFKKGKHFTGIKIKGKDGLVSVNK